MLKSISNAFPDPVGCLSLLRCLEDPLQSVRKTILDSLNLQAEPHVSVPGMAQIREQWRNMFTSTTNPVEQNTGGNLRLWAFHHIVFTGVKSHNSVIINQTPAPDAWDRCAELVLVLNLEWSSVAWLVNMLSFSFLVDNKPPSSFSSSSSSSGNATHLQCCMFASQVFMKGLFMS